MKKFIYSISSINYVKYSGVKFDIILLVKILK